jgi:hypothetical protein
MTFLSVLIGASLIIYGRKLYWVFVGALGFAATSYLTTQYLRGMNDWLILGLSLGIGIIGALLAVWMQSFAIGLAGFLGGGQIVLSLLAYIGLVPRSWAWIPFIIGGILGVILVVSLFDWALIILSSFGGASLITQVIHLPRPMVLLVFIILAVLGIIIQARVMALEKE